MQEIYIRVMVFISDYNRRVPRITNSILTYMYVHNICIYKVIYNIILALVSLESHAISTRIDIKVDPEMSRAPWKFRNALLSLLRSYLGVIKRRVSSIRHCMYVYRRAHNILCRTCWLITCIVWCSFRSSGTSLCWRQRDLIESRGDP